MVDDDKSQADIAEALIRANQVFASRTVLLETEWVLRSVYRLDCKIVADVLEQLPDAENPMIENAEQVSHATEWYKVGADFSDALHLAVCGGATIHPVDRGFLQGSAGSEVVKQKVKAVIGRRYGRTLEEMIKELNPVLRGWSNYHRRAGAERRHFRKLNTFVRERLRIFLKRKYSDPTRGTRRLLGNRLVRLGLYQLA